MAHRTLCTMVGVLALLLVGVSTAMADAPPKTDICHFQPENGTWKKISVGGGPAPPISRTMMMPFQVA